MCANPDNDTNTCIELFNEENKDIYIKSQENIRGGVVLVNSKFEIDGRFKKYWVSSQENYDELVYFGCYKFVWLLFVRYFTIC